MTFPVLPANGPSGYNLTNSLRFRSSATAYLNRTLASTSSTTTWTWSGWYKRGALATGNAFFSASDGGGGSGYWCQMVLNSSDKLNFIVFSGGVGSISGNKTTTAVYRDPSAWYHIVFVFNTTSATAEDRMQIWVNGVRVTAWDTNTLISQNFAGYINNSTYVHELGALYYTPNTNFVDGYMAEVNFIDGQALTPSSFGSTDSTTGVWQPARYTGTYGTNGFYLPFTNTTSTTTLGNDFSGNGNNWTTNNISLTPGVTYDAMTDVPTLTSATAANYAVLNPLSIYVVNPTDGNLAFSGTSAGGIGSMGATSGKYYWETVYTAIGSGDGVIVGVRSAESIATGAAENVGYYGGGTQSGQKIINGGAGTAYGATWTTGDVIGVALDITGGSITFYKNNVSQGAISYTFTGKSWVSFNWRTGSAGTNTGSINFGQRPFAYTPPSGFVALNTFNLPSSTIPNGANFMAATLYTGAGTAQVISNAVGSASFQPDFVWQKARAEIASHRLADSVRGVDKVVYSNLTNAEATEDGVVDSFNSNGFTGGGSNAVTSGLTAVAWQWKGGGTAVTNTAGSITSTVSANTTSGFSVVTWTAGSGTQTVGHGLNVAPSMFIIKARDGTFGWWTYHVSLGSGQYLALNTTAAATTLSWGGSPTSSVFTVNDNFTVSTYSYVAYCFAPIAGFSAFGSYTGNGSTDGPFIYTGFRPRWLMIKRTDTTADWFVYDTSRNTYNTMNLVLFPNSSSAEGVTGGPSFLDIVSNGFKPRGTEQAINNNNGTYIYACFAENPFRNALAR